MLSQKLQDWLGVWGDRFNAPEIRTSLDLQQWARRKLEQVNDPLLRMVIEDLLEQLPTQILQ